MDRDRRLIRHGCVLFPLALLTGLVAYRLVNPRMGVAYANRAIPSFSAAVGASQPKLAGSGFEAAPWAELLLQWSPLGGVAAPILCALLVLRGLGRRVAT